MAITPLPTPPSRSAPVTFSDLADAFLGALPTFATEANELAAAMNLNATSATSVTSIGIGTGSKILVVDISKSFQPGMTLKAAVTSSPNTNWMHGDVTSYSATTGTLVMNITNVLGSGTHATWTITFSAPMHNLAAPGSMGTTTPIPIIVIESERFKTATELTIAASSGTITQSVHIVDTTTDVSFATLSTRNVEGDEK